MVSPVKSWRKVSQAPIKITECLAGCGAQVEYRTNPRVYCPPCKLKINREKARRSMEVQRRKRGIQKVKGRVIACETCGEKVVLNRNPDTKYCPPCGIAKTQERARRVARARKGNPDGWKYATEWEKRRKAADPAFAMNCRISKYMATSLRRGKGGRKWQSLVGYTLSDLMAHLERQFVKGMSWENRDDWEIDHIVPLAAHKFESADDPEFKAAWALTNLRPLWKVDNRKKHATRTHLI